MQQTIAQLGADAWIGIAGIAVTLLLALLSGITAALVWLGRILLGIRDQVNALSLNAQHAGQRLDEQCERLDRIEQHVFPPATALAGGAR